MDERRHEKPEAREDPASEGNYRENHVENPGCEVEETPDTAKNDRLHRVEADELVVLFEDVKNKPADERDAGKRGRDVRGQPRRGGGVRTGSRSGVRGRNRGRVNWIWHVSFRGTRARFVKATRVPFRFRALASAGTIGPS